LNDGNRRFDEDTYICYLLIIVLRNSHYYINIYNVDFRFQSNCN